MATARQVVAAWLQAYNDHDEEQIRSHYDDNVIFEAPGDIRLEGVDAAVEKTMTWLLAFPDGEIRVENEVANGDWLALQLVFEGTHEDTLVGAAGKIPATNRCLAFRAVEFVRVEDGKITEEYLCFDQAQVLTQLGLMPELAASL
jgi:steroid delta-isomerase-like uncharacterized protein